ncbi:MAG: branched-chain amino acid ABC transporter permease [Deltaproteobacteria bacterium]|uniref:Branched-chain amino acid ABC transporter permease n=1 Tax=Candidatus Zymogenus saltonus TaxID=2844893 RepID=A0A9D8KGK0_9DELT|nr:branched-chain amino acid ABC transporter permease [Candidatus Zymogenus saltonus]
MNTPETMAYLTIQGLATGSLYGMIALGVVMIYKTNDVLNFAHGNMGLFSTFLIYMMMTKYTGPISAHLFDWACRIGILGGLNVDNFSILAFALIAVLTAVFAFFFGVILEVVFLRPAKEPSHLGLIVITIGLWQILDGTIIGLFGTEVYAMPPPLSDFKLFKLGKIPIDQLDLIILGITSCIIVVLYLFFRFTRLGIAMRATFQNREAAGLMGIGTRTIFAVTWGISSVLAATAGILTAAKLNLDNTVILFPFLKAFSAAVLGGLGSLPGVIIGGWMLGVSENLFGSYISMGYKTPFAFIVIIVVLIIRPEGLLSTRIKRGV